MLKSEILQYLKELNGHLGAADIKGEICLYGGAVMCVFFDSRPSTKDVDAIFQPAGKMREAARPRGRTPFDQEAQSENSEGSACARRKIPPENGRQARLAVFY